MLLLSIEMAEFLFNFIFIDMLNSTFPIIHDSKGSSWKI